MSLYFSLLRLTLIYFTLNFFPHLQENSPYFVLTKSHQMLFSDKLLRRILKYTVKLSKQYKRKSLCITKASEIQKLSYKMWPNFSEYRNWLLIMESECMGFTINLMRVLVYIDSFFLLYPSETSNHIQYTVTDLNKKCLNYFSERVRLNFSVFYVVEPMGKTNSAYKAKIWGFQFDVLEKYL